MRLPRLTASYLNLKVDPRFQYQNPELFRVLSSVELIRQIVYSMKLAIRTISPTSVRCGRPLLGFAIETGCGNEKVPFVVFAGHTGSPLFGLPVLSDPVSKRGRADELR
jgi:hypothetical protein